MPETSFYRASIANDYFHDALSNKRHYEAVVRWEEGLDVGTTFEPYESLGDVVFGEIAESVSTDGFGHVVRVLVEDGAIVKPGQPILEVQERDPTLAEWDYWRTRAWAAEAERAKWERRGRNPLRGLYYALTGHD